MSNINYAPDGFAGGASTLPRSDSSFDRTIDSVSAPIESKKGTWNAISPAAVGRMRLQNRFLTGLDVARFTAGVMRRDMAAYDADPTQYTQSLGAWHGFVA